MRCTRGASASASGRQPYGRVKSPAASRHTWHMHWSDDPCSLQRSPHAPLSVIHCPVQVCVVSCRVASWCVMSCRVVLNRRHSAVFGALRLGINSVLVSSLSTSCASNNQSCLCADWLAYLGENPRPLSRLRSSRAKVPTASHPALHPQFLRSSSCRRSKPDYSFPLKTHSPAPPTTLSEQATVLHRLAHIHITRSWHQYIISTKPCRCAPGSRGKRDNYRQL